MSLVPPVVWVLDGIETSIHHYGRRGRKFHGGQEIGAIERVLSGDVTSVRREASRAVQRTHSRRRDTVTTGRAAGYGFGFIVHSSSVTMSQKPSIPQAAKPVSQVLTADN
jgi:hypothetical protein